MYSNQSVNSTEAVSRSIDCIIYGQAHRKDFDYKTEHLESSFTGEIMVMNVSITAIAEPLVIHKDMFEKILIGQKGKKVIIRLGSSEDLTRTVRDVTGSLLQLRAS